MVIAALAFLGLVGFAAPFVGLAAGASSSEKKSAAVLRAAFALAGFDSAGAGAALRAFAGFGAAITSDFLAFLAVGAASGAPVDVLVEVRIRVVALKKD
jgi:hypothetical protein